MIKFRKAAIAIGLSAMMVTSFATTSFANQIVYQKVEDEIISSGVTYKNILRFTKNGWLNLNAVYIDLNNNNTELDVLTSSKGLSTKETLSTMVKNKGDVVAAINGDFFYMLNPDSPLGAIVKDGEMISSPITVHDYATFFINNNGQAFADYWKHQIYATTSSGANIPISTINKYTDEYQYIMLIDKNWGTHSPGYNTNLQDMVEVVVIDDVVTEIRQKQPAVQIPENGYILLAAKGKSPWAQSDKLLGSVKVGDKLTIHKDINPGIENIKLAMGGGTVLVKNGQVATFTQTISGAAQRTAIGITKDRSQIIFVTIDGRHSSYKGVDGKELANYLIELGSYEAILMDGGGSTTMVTRGQGEFDSKVVNHLSEGSERRITNGIAVISTAPVESLRGIKAELDDNKSFVGASRKINVKAFDKNYNPLNVDYSNVNLSVKSGEGTFDGMYFTPSKQGKTVIGVEYLGGTSEVTLDVLGELSHMEISPETVRLNYGHSTGFEVVGVDTEGYRTKINSKDINWKDVQGLGTFSNGIYVAGSKSGTTKLEASFGNKVATVNVVVGSNTSMINNFETLNTGFVGYPQSVVGSVALDSNAKEGKSSLKLQYDFTQTDETRAAYITFDSNKTVISTPANSIGVWAHATNPATHWIRGKVKDASGAEYVIDFKKNIDWTGWKYLTAPLPANMVYPIKFERLYVVETDATQKIAGQILFDGLEASYSIASPSKESSEATVIKDKLNKPYKIEGRKLFAYSGIQFKDYTLLDRIVGNKISSLINNKHELSLFTGNVDSRLSSNIKKQIVSAKSGYGSTEQGDSLIIQLDNLKDGLRQTNFDQWPWLQNLVNNTTKKNVFIVMSKPIFGNGGFTDKLEADLLMDTLTDLSKKGKQVFVLYEGQSLSVDVINGVRYISTGVYNSNASKDQQETFKYIEFNINDKEVTYQIKSLFE